MVPPGFSSPLASAASIIFTAIRSLELPPGLRYSTFAATVPAPSGMTEFRRTSGVPPMRSLMCCAIRMRSSSQAEWGRAHPLSGHWPYLGRHCAGRCGSAKALAGGLADVLPDLAQRTDRLGHHRPRRAESREPGPARPVPRPAHQPPPACLRPTARRAAAPRIRTRGSASAAARVRCAPGARKSPRRLPSTLFFAAALATKSTSASNAFAGNIASVLMLGCACLSSFASCSSGEIATSAAGSSPSSCSRCARASARYPPAESPASTIWSGS